MDNKKKIIVLSVIVIITCLTCMFLFLNFTSSKGNNTSDPSEKLGEIAIEPSEDGDFLSTGDGEDETSTVQCSYTNMDVLDTSYMPYNGFRVLNKQTWDWLVENNLSDVTEVTIIEDSIIPDKNQPSFNCKLNDSHNTTIWVRFNVGKKCFIFDFL